MISFVLIISIHIQSYVWENDAAPTNFASDCTGCGDEGPGIPGILGTMVTGLTSYPRESELRPNTNKLYFISN